VTATILVKVDALTIGVKRNFTRAAWRSAEIGQGADESVWGQDKGIGVLPFVCVFIHMSTESVFVHMPKEIASTGVRAACGGVCNAACMERM
jgi:hypothetical protein